METTFINDNPLYEETSVNPLYYDGNSLEKLLTHPSLNNDGITTPYLHICNNPQSKFRFRYAVETNGAQHGCLMAESTDKNKKVHIQVQLNGCFEEEAIIRCTLVTNSSNPIPHAHQLSHNSEATGNCYHDVLVSKRNNWTAIFSGLTIIRTIKKQVREIIEQRMRKEALNGGALNRNEEKQLKDKAASLATTMDLHSVKLKFECLVERSGLFEAFTLPVYSTPIYNLKNPNAGDLKIVRINKVHGSCSGLEEIFIFVEQVNKKDIKIRFFETDANDQVIWSAFADFSELDVHHQYAIAFKTPPYRDQNIESSVMVQFELYRPSNESVSESKLFTYTPREYAVPGVKRQRHEEPTFFNSRYQPQPFLSQQIVPEINSPQMNVPHYNPGVTPLHQPSAQHAQLEEFQLSHNEKSSLDRQSFPSLGQKEVTNFDLTRLSLDQEFLQFLNDDYWLTDGSSSTTDLHKKQPAKLEQTELPSKLTANAPFTCSSAMLSTYAMNMTKALRRYTKTGDTSTLLTRMQHLMSIQCERGNNALHDAVIHNQIDVVRTLLRASHSTDFVNTKNNFNRCPLYVAVLHERREAIALLLEYGADPNISDVSGNNSFHIAASDRFDCLELLLKLTDPIAGINTRNYAGLTPLHIAIKAADIRSVELLCSKSDVNCFESKQGRSPLQLAVLTKNVPIINQLLLHPLVDVNMHSYDGATALSLAVMAGQTNICSILTRHGACPLDQSSDSEEEDDDDVEDEEEDGYVECDSCNLNEEVVEKKSNSCLNSVPKDNHISNTRLVTPKSSNNQQELDSGVDLLTSKELTYELDSETIGELAEILDSPSKGWAKLADSFGMFQSMGAVIMKQTSPTTYLLENLDLWEVPIATVSVKLRELNLDKAADILDDYILHST